MSGDENRLYLQKINGDIPEEKKDRPKKAKSRWETTNIQEESIPVEIHK